MQLFFFKSSNDTENEGDDFILFYLIKLCNQYIYVFFFAANVKQGMKFVLIQEGESNE